MRKILLLVLVLVSFSAFGQVVQFPTNYGVGYRRTGADTLLWIPTDTFPVPAALSARTHIARKGVNLYYWTGTKWEGLSGGVTDTTSLSNRINLKVNIADTTNMLSPYLRSNVGAATYATITNLALKLNITDTANKWITSVYRKTASDSVFYTKGSSHTFAFKDSTGGGSSTTPKTWTFILSGQSNAWGANDANSLDTASNSRVLVWNHAETVPQWRTFRINQRPLRTSTYNEADGGSGNPQWAGSNNHTFYFAKKMAQYFPNDTIKIIMAIGDGSPISNWSNGTTQKYLDSIITRGNASGITKVDGFIWDQGESNTSNGANLYKQYFDSIKQVLRRQTWFPRTTPIVVVGMPKVADGASSTYVGMDTLFQWMDRGDDMWVGYARTDSCLIDNNQVHFDTTALKKIGEDRIWQAYWSLPHRFNELYQGFTTDTLGNIRYNVTSGTITEANNLWTMATNAYATDTTHYIIGDGVYEVSLNSTGIYIFGLDTSNTNEFYYNGSTHTYLYGGSVISGTIYAFNKGNAAQTAVNTTPNIDALRIARTGTTVKLWARVKDFYIPLYTYTTASSDTLFPKVSAYNSVVFNTPKISIYSKAYETSNDWLKPSGRVGIGTTSPDSVLTVTGGVNISRGVKLSNLSSFTDTSSYKPLVINSSGSLYKATYWPGSGGGTPAGNYGNIQINRNGSFATPASDSLIYTASGGLANLSGIFTGTSTTQKLTLSSSTGSILQYNSTNKVNAGNGAVTITFGGGRGLTFGSGGTGHRMTPDAGDFDLGSSTNPIIKTYTNSIVLGYASKSADYTITASDCIIEVTATGKTITLPTAVGVTGVGYTIKLTASGTGTVATTSSQTIDGATTYSLSAQYKYVKVVSNGSNWIIIANN